MGGGGDDASKVSLSVVEGSAAMSACFLPSAGGLSALLIAGFLGEGRRMPTVSLLRTQSCHKKSGLLRLFGAAYYMGDNAQA